MRILKFEIRLLFFVLIAVVVGACNADTKLSYDDEFNLLLNKKIVLPDSLGYIIDGQADKLSECKLYDNSYSVISIMSGDCDKCARKIRDWNSFVGQLERDSLNVNILFFININDSAYFFDHIYPLIEMPKGVPLVLNYDLAFQHTNKYYTSVSDFHTMLLNPDDNIVLLGDPTINSKIKYMYIRKIKGVND